MIKVSIIIPSFNTKTLTLACINSVIKHTKGISYEIIVVDNGSTDNTPRVILDISHQTLNIRLLRNKSNLGFAKAANQGIKKARGKYILLLNSDTYLKEDVVVKLVNFAEKTPDAGVVAPRLLNQDGSIQPSVFHFPTLKNAVLQYWFGKKGLMDKYTPFLTRIDLVKVDAVVGAAFLITPRAMEKIGLFDERYFMYYEDLDYCQRIKRAGLKVYYLPKVEIVHLHGASGESLADNENQWKRLIPSSKRYHGIVRHYLLTLIIWISQKARRFFGR